MPNIRDEIHESVELFLSGWRELEEADRFAVLTYVGAAIFMLAWAKLGLPITWAVIGAVAGTLWGSILYLSRAELSGERKRETRRQS